jgi:hypothetical protein
MQHWCSTKPQDNFENEMDCRLLAAEVRDAVATQVVKQDREYAHKMKGAHIFVERLAL